MAFEIDNSLMNANRPRTIRFTDELYEELEKTASNNNVSFNKLVLRCCRYALNNMEHPDHGNK